MWGCYRHAMLQSGRWEDVPLIIPPLPPKFANQITTVEEAEGFYPLFGLGANVALIFSGQAVKYFSEVRKRERRGGLCLCIKAGMLSASNHAPFLSHQQLKSLFPLPSSGARPPASRR